jgi:hypothetical protein
MRPFVVKDQNYILPKKSVFNKIIGDSGFELEFAAFLDNCHDVISFAKNYISIKFYIETTMFNYYFDNERDGHVATISMFEAASHGKYEGYTSEYVLLELKNAHEPKRSNMLNLIDKYNIKTLYLTIEIEQLATFIYK